MEYISADEFLKQPKEVQRIFLEYFDHEKMLFLDGVIYFGTFKDEGKHIPLLTEGQLRKFIEDKTRYKVEAPWHGCYDIYLVDQLTGQEVIKDYFNLDTDLLKAYWKVACEIASNGGEF